MKICRPAITALEASLSHCVGLLAELACPLWCLFPRSPVLLSSLSQLDPPPEAQRRRPWKYCDSR